MGDTGIKKLAELIAGLSYDAERATAERAVLLYAVGALVQSHPNPEAFAAAFRRCWLLADEPNKSAPSGSEEQAGIDAVLSVLEELCPVPLGIRPPDKAENPHK